jgi:trimethylamine monooxygenase
LFEVEAYWAAKYIAGDLQLPEVKKMKANWEMWADRRGYQHSRSNGQYMLLDILHNHCRCERLSGHGLDAIAFQGDHVRDLSEDSGYPYDLSVDQIFNEWYDSKLVKPHGILTYRDQRYTSKFSGTESPSSRNSFMQAFDDSIEAFVNPQY